jgi:hypothetical protein
MKKTYMSPLCEEIKLNSSCTLLNSSSVKGMNLEDFDGYGGVDADGDKDPSSREFDDFDEDFDEEEF